MIEWQEISGIFLQAYPFFSLPKVAQIILAYLVGVQAPLKDDVRVEWVVHGEGLGTFSPGTGDLLSQHDLSSKT